VPSRDVRAADRGPGFEGQSGLSEEPADEGGSVLDALEPVLDDGGELVNVAGGKVAQAVLHVRPDALGGIEVGCVGGSCSTVSQSW
jgi:hypothetical protein